MRQVFQGLSYKSWGVVVLDGFCIAEGLQNGVCLQQLFLQFPLTEKTECQSKLQTPVTFYHDSDLHIGQPGPTLNHACSCSAAELSLVDTNMCNNLFGLWKGIRLFIQKTHLRGCCHCLINHTRARTQTHIHAGAQTNTHTHRHTYIATHPHIPTLVRAAQQAHSSTKNLVRPSLSMQAQTREHKKHTGRLAKIPQRKCRSALWHPKTSYILHHNDKNQDWPDWEKHSCWEEWDTVT